MLDWSRYPNFTRAEFTCRCGCGRADMDPKFMARLQMMRNRSLKPFIVTSGFRCPDYNARISTTKRNGPHTTGHAVDILCAGGVAHDFLQLAMSEGFSGIGLNQKGPHKKRFLHIDDLPHGDHPRPWVWTYD